MDRPEIPREDNQLLEWTNVFLSHRWLIVFLGFLFGAIAYAGCKTLRTRYTATASLVANRFAESQSLARLFQLNMGRTGEEMMDVFSTLYLSSYYMEILQSDALMQKLVDRRWSNGKTVAEMFEIQSRPGTDPRQRALILLRRAVFKVRQNRGTGMLSVECTMPDPNAAAEMANALVGELRTLLAERRTSGTGELVRAAEARTSDSALALTRADKNREAFEKRNKQILSADRTAASPELKSQHEQLLREVKVQEDTFIKLKSSLTLLRLSEQQRANLIDVIQPAEPPLFKSWPPTKQAAAGAALFGFMLGAALAFVRHGIWKMSALGVAGYDEFAAHVRAMNWYMPGLILLLPRPSRRKRLQKSDGSDESDKSDASSGGSAP